MNKEERIIETITEFVKAGDTSNLELLEKVLHAEFKVASNRFMGTDGITIIDRQKYISNVKEGVFGGLPRTMTIENVDESDSIAHVKLRLESAENYFVSYNSLVLDTDGRWKLIYNLAVVEGKQ